MSLYFSFRALNLFIMFRKCVSNNIGGAYVFVFISLVTSLGTSNNNRGGREAHILDPPYISAEWATQRPLPREGVLIACKSVFLRGTDLSGSVPISRFRLQSFQIENEIENGPGSIRAKQPIGQPEMSPEIVNTKTKSAPVECF